MAFICPMCDREQLVKGILRTQGLINALTGHPGTQLTGKATNQELTVAATGYSFSHNEGNPLRRDIFVTDFSR
jgi:hypothetical protein